MSESDMFGRREFLAGILGGMGGTAALTTAMAEARTIPVPVPSDLDPTAPLTRNWDKPLSGVATVDLSVITELKQSQTLQRHRVYSGLVMALVHRFWNGNNRGPHGLYPYRERQKVGPSEEYPSFFRYRGDRVPGGADNNRIDWDRYLGHNIACLAIDGKGEIIDFDFNHNNVFRSSAEHAEARIVRRLFSLTDIFDNWKTGTPMDVKSRAFSLDEVTIYTSLESCAQCSGIMSLAGVKQVVYLQNDPGAYRIGNIMYNLAADDKGDHLAALPIPATAFGLPYLEQLNLGFAAFAGKISKANARKDPNGSYFVSPVTKEAEFASPQITSYLCTDDAYDIFEAGANAFLKGKPTMPPPTISSSQEPWTAEECLAHAQAFYHYADVEGYRGSPHSA